MFRILVFVPRLKERRESNQEKLDSQVEGFFRFARSNVLVLERTRKYRTSNTSNINTPNFEHIEHDSQILRPNFEQVRPNMEL